MIRDFSRLATESAVRPSSASAGRAVHERGWKCPGCGRRCAPGFACAPCERQAPGDDRPAKASTDPAAAGLIARGLTAAEAEVVLPLLDGRRTLAALSIALGGLSIAETTLRVRPLLQRRVLTTSSQNGGIELSRSWKAAIGRRSA